MQKQNEEKNFLVALSSLVILSAILGAVLLICLTSCSMSLKNISINGKEATSSDDQKKSNIQTSTPRKICH